MFGMFVEFLQFVSAHGSLWHELKWGKC